MRSLLGSTGEQIVWVGLLSAVLSACGSKKDEPAPNPAVTTIAACASGCTGKGQVAKNPDGKDTVSIDFSNVTANAQYIVMPYILGDLTKISGSLAAHNFNFNITGSAGAPAKLQELWVAPAPATSPWQAAVQRDQDLRTLANHFRPEKGEAQGAWFWQMARTLDRQAHASQHAARRGIEAAYRLAGRNASRHRRADKPSLQLTSGGCPSSTVLIPTIDSSGKGATKSVNFTTPVVTGDNYCVVYLSTPVTEPDTSAIKQSVETILKVYTTKIYNDTFPALGSYNFRPTFVVVDISDTKVWSDSAALQLAGAFLSFTADAANMPLIYIAADFNKVPTFASAPAATLKTQFHSVMAHEMQHAILNYYRRDSAGASGNLPEEPVAIDEGLAHYMEDLFGYGDDAFGFWAKSFLLGFTDGAGPFLAGSADYTPVTQNAARSSAHTLMYYLSSQKGGVNFSNGLPSGGGGLAYIADVVKNKTSAGPTNLATAFSDDWTTVIGNYLGALAIDNVTLPDPVAAVNTVQTPVATLSDLTGGTGKNYGMRFNNFKDLKDHISTGNEAFDKSTDSPKLSSYSYYMTKPLLYTVADPTQSLQFQCDCGGDTKNIAVSLVRIK